MTCTIALTKYDLCHIMIILIGAVKEGLVCNRKFCRFGQCGEEHDEYCFDGVSQDYQGDTTYCAAFYVYKNSTMTWIPQYKLCFHSKLSLYFSKPSSSACFPNRNISLAIYERESL